MTPISVHIENPSPEQRNSEPIAFGVPFQRGMLKDTSDMCLVNELGQRLPVQAESRARWPDGSIQWAFVETQVDIGAGETAELQLSVSCGGNPRHRQALQLTDAGDSVTIHSGPLRFKCSKRELSLPVFVSNSDTPSASGGAVVLRDTFGKSWRARIDNTEIVAPKTGICAAVNSRGRFADDANDLGVRFTSRLRFFAGLSRVEWTFMVHNPAAAKHKGGFWDLGDPGSLFFEDLSVDIALPTIDELSYRTTSSEPWCKASGPNLSIYQESSAGENWNGPNHKNRDGAVPLKQNGYTIMDGPATDLRASRATPVVHALGGSARVTVFVDQFWQNFPKAIDVTRNTLTIRLFPGCFPDAFELQGGERKTHTVWLDFADDRESLNGCMEPLRVAVARTAYQDNPLLPFFMDSPDSSISRSLITEGLEGPGNFFAKREIVDEYGWRNFGDVFADHETLEHGNDWNLVSHYNNQYDLIYGFGRQFIRSGDHRWLELMNDLARHVADIDVYHTLDDRPEYNNGLFWHTDHYLDAATCSHRSYSRRHMTSHHVAQSGGGPGTEHGYTTGLLLHYFLTGSETSRSAARELADWMGRAQEGSGGLLEEVQRIRTKQFPKFKRLIRGIDVPTFRYPLTRGTANYVNMLVDQSIINADKEQLRHAARVIRETAHPHDDIAQRNLLDVERAWSYTVFLQSVCRFLYLKELWAEHDADFAYARDCLLHYAAWMMDHETPYLDRPEMLDYPNHTWVAQDVRKAQIFFAASRHTAEQNDELRAAGLSYLDYVIASLNATETRAFARILAILMQNDFDPAWFDPTRTARTTDLEDTRKNHGEHPPQYTATSLCMETARRLGASLLRLSLRGEYAWLRHRLEL